jgi:hypothetical protein
VIRRAWNGLRGAFRNLWTFKGGLTVAALLYAYIAVKATVRAQDGDGSMHVIGPLALALFPVCVFMAFRYPIVFPFLAYVSLLPFDSLLEVTAGSTIVKLIGIATLVALLFRMLLTRHVLLPPRAWYWWLGLMAYATLTLLWIPDWPVGKLVYTSMLSLFAMMTVLAIYPATRTEFKLVMAGVVVSGIGAAAIAVDQYLHNNVNSEGWLTVQTAGGIELDHNYLAASFLLPMALALAGAFYSRRLSVQLPCGIALLFMMFGLLLAGSRGGFIAAVVVFLYFAIRTRYRVQVIAVSAVAIGLSAFAPTVWERFARENGSGSGRTFIWQTGMHTFKEHWLFGSGVGSYQFNYDRSVLDVYQQIFQGWGRPGHSIVFVSLNDFGVIGLCIVLAAWFFSAYQLRVIPKGHWLFGARLAFESAIIALFSQALFIDPFSIKYVWLAVSLPMLLMNMYAPHRLGALREVRPAPNIPPGRPAPRLGRPRAARGL